MAETALDRARAALTELAEERASLVQRIAEIDEVLPRRKSATVSTERAKATESVKQSDRALEYLRANPGKTPTQLSAETGVSKGTVTYLVSKGAAFLEGRKLFVTEEGADETEEDDAPAPRVSLLAGGRR